MTSGAEDWPGEIVLEAGRPTIRPRIRAIRETIEKVSSVLPAFAGLELEGVWAGALDLTPDALPVLDKAHGLDNMVVAAGFSGHGFGIGPVTGQIAAQLACGITPDHDITPFRLARVRGRCARKRPAHTSRLGGQTTEEGEIHAEA